MWLGTYKQKKIIKLAPDAVVQINDKKTIEICPICHGQIDISNYLTSVQTSLAGNATVGTASFSLAMPRHGHIGNYMVRGGRVFGLNLMDEVSIYIKARYPFDERGNRQYYKVFWGVITGISESYTDGVQTISVNCESMMKWLQIMKTNEHPSFNVSSDPRISNYLAPAIIAGKSYAGLNAYQLIHCLMNITYLNLIVPDNLGTEQERTKNGETNTLSPITTKDIDLTNSWRKKFSKISQSLRMFGTTSTSFSKKETENKDKATNVDIADATKASKNPYSPFIINYDSAALMDFKPFAGMENSKNADLIHNNYKDNLTIIGEIAIGTGFEFYLDTVGEFIFKPPFWNLDVKQNPVYVFKDSDIINWDFVESTEHIITRLMVTGSLLEELPTESTYTPRGCFTNYALARQFGLIPDEITMRYYYTPQTCYYHAISEMDRRNANRFQGSLTIIGRPELRLGMPIYIESRDCYGYIENISHNFTFGSTFTTQIQINAIRRKYIGTDPMAASFDETLGNNIKNIKVRGSPVILLYKNDFDSLQETQNKDTQTLLQDNVVTNISTQTKDIAKNMALTDQFFKSNRSGVYEEVLLTDKRASMALSFAQKAKNENNQNDYLKFLELAIPVSDEYGYELIGSYENGRSLYLDSNNVLRKKANSFSEILKQSQNKNNPKDNSSRDMSPGFQEYDKKQDEDLLSSLGAKPKGDEASTSVKNFYIAQATFLKNLSPELDVNIKKCSCHDPNLTGLLNMKTTVGSKNNQPIANSEGK